MSKPMITVTVYMASCPPITPISSISTIFPAIKKRIPSGAYLQISKQINMCWTNRCLLAKFYWYNDHKHPKTQFKILGSDKSTRWRLQQWKWLQQLLSSAVVRGSKEEVRSRMQSVHLPAIYSWWTPVESWLPFRSHFKQFPEDFFCVGEYLGGVELA